MFESGVFNLLTLRIAKGWIPYFPEKIADKH